MSITYSAATDAAAFESFYKEVRGRLLLQTWALTGDLPAAQKAVRDSLVIAWHHWPKVSQLEDPQEYVRPIAWSHALRRASVRPFHKERGFDEGIRATLHALERLPIQQRRIVLLAHLTTLPLEQIAQSVGLSLARAERELKAGTAAFAVRRGVDATQILSLFEPLAAQLRDVRWPRTSILTRTGSRRRRTFTALGAGIAVASFVGAGVVATDPSGAKPALNVLALNTAQSPTPPSGYPLITDTLLSEGIVANELSGRWTTEMTSDNANGDGLVLRCQPSRYTERNSRATLMRSLSSTTDSKDGATLRTVGQTVEVAATPAAATEAWQRSLEWYGTCGAERVQLASTREVTGVGDQAALVVLRDWSKGGRTVVASLARTGSVVTSVVTDQPANTERPVGSTTDLLSLAVTKLCNLPETGRCAEDAANESVAPLPLPTAPSMLGVLDLPPVSGIKNPWTATDPVRATQNLAATPCDESIFRSNSVKNDRTRTFVIPDAPDLAAQFGLVETIGTWKSADAAKTFARDVRAKIESCPQEKLGTQVEEIESSNSSTGSIRIWRVRSEISDNRSVEFVMALIRNGAKIAQIGLVPDANHRISTEAWIDLATRAGERLALTK